MRLDRGFVVVDELCRSAASAISAVGDLVTMAQQQGHPQLAHLGFAEGILVAERVSGLDVHPIDYHGVPRITYSDPEVASVGLTSAQVAERGLEIVEVNYPLGGNGRSVIRQTQGAAKVIAERDADGSGPERVLGVHLVGSGVGELIAEGQLIYNWDAEPANVAQLIHRTRPSPRSSAKHISRWPASPCTSTPNFLPQAHPRSHENVGLRIHAAARRERHLAAL